MTLGEGGTPLLRLPSVSDGAYAKVEAANPTGSFKDRGVSHAVSWARAAGLRRVVSASTGNTSAAVAAYAARAGLPVTVLLPEATPAAKVAQAAAAGARMVEVEGGFDDCHALAEQLGDADPDTINITSTYACPWMTAANRGVADELLGDLGTPPATVVVPVGAGPLLGGLVEGFEALSRAGAIPGLPRMVAVQAAGCAPIAAAFDAGADEVRAWDAPAETIAGSIADRLTGYAHHGTATLDAVRRSGGMVVAVDDDAIVRAQADLAGNEGLVVEPGAAAALAGWRVAEARIEGGGPAVLLLTGHGLKDPGHLPPGRAPLRIPADVAPEALAELLGG